MSNWVEEIAKNGSVEEVKETLAWVRDDLRHLLKEVDRYKSIGKSWVAGKVLENAKHSQNLINKLENALDRT